MLILGDFTTSVRKALKEIDPKYRDYNALVVCGSHTPDKWNISRIIANIKKAREQNTPTLLICWGHQLGAIEYARNVLGIENATSEEFFDPTIWDFDIKGIPVFVVKKLPRINVGLHDGETYWNNYEVDEDILKLWKKNNNFITCQYHPEYQSSKGAPHKILLKFLDYCKK